MIKQSGVTKKSELRAVFCKKRRFNFVFKAVAGPENYISLRLNIKCLSLTVDGKIVL